MKKTLLAATIIGTLIASPAFAAGAFDGPYVSLGAGFASTTETLVADKFNFTITKNGLVGQIAAGYSMSLPRGFNIAGNIFDRSYLNYSKKDPYDVQAPNSWGIALEPGYYLNSDTLLYTTFSYVQGYFRTSLSDSEDPAGESIVYTNTRSGFGYGFGIKHLLSQQFFIGVEAQQIWFPQENLSLGGPNLLAKFNNLVGTINVGYIF